MNTTAKSVLIKVCSALDVKPEDVLSLSRKRELVDARFIAVDMVWDKLGKEETGKDVGSWFFKGIKVSPHSMVIHATKRVSELIATNKKFRGKYNQCRMFVYDELNYDAIPQY